MYEYVLSIMISHNNKLNINWYTMHSNDKPIHFQVYSLFVCILCDKYIPSKWHSYKW